MSSIQCRFRIITVLILIVGGLLPPYLYWQFVGRTATLSPEKAKEWLAKGNGESVLIDVRGADGYQEKHIEAAANWPFEQIMAMKSSEALPQEFHGKRLLLICESGILSAVAAKRLHELAIPDVFNVEGGMQRWVASAERSCLAGTCRMRIASGESQNLPFRASSMAEQWGAVLTGFVVKPLYTLISLVLVVWLWRQTTPDLAALRWALLFFFVGENFCAANYLFFNDGSIGFEHLHSFGMVVCFGMTVFAVIEGFDRRFVRFSDLEEKCAALGLCRGCIKYVQTPCGFHRVFLFMIPAVMVVCLMPLSADLLPVSCNTEILGTFYNYSHPVVHQIYELRYLPAAALLMLAISWGVLIWKRTEPVLWSKLFFSAGIGALGFSFFRMVLFHVYQDHLAWFGVWEEVTELIFIIGAGCVLWFFRFGLFSKPLENGK